MNDKEERLRGAFLLSLWLLPSLPSTPEEGDSPGSLPLGMSSELFFLWWGWMALTKSTEGQDLFECVEYLPD